MTTLKPLVGERHDNESKKAVLCCNDYLRMGPGRSLAKLHRKYTEPSRIKEPPTTSLRWMKEWSRRFDWQDRAAEWDAGAEERKNRAYRQAMETGLALDYERVDELKKLANFLIVQIYERGPDGEYYNVWVPDVKSVGSGDYVEIVDIERFNSAIFSQLRGVLDDLAQETGGRVKKQEITGAEGGPVETHNTITLTQYIEENAESA